MRKKILILRQTALDIKTAAEQRYKHRLLITDF